MRMETARRRFGAYREDLIRHRWPELLEFGLNSEPTWVRGVKKARAARDWARATAGQARRRLRRP
jgi:hypothetical protein